MGMGAIVLLLLALAIQWHYASGSAPGMIGYDMGLYLDATRGWLAGEPFYPAWQVAGPYAIGQGAILYPPSSIPLFAAFTILPAPLFWIIPLGVIALVVAYHRPAPWTWPIMAAGLAFPPTEVRLTLGNPAMWAAAAVALGTVYGWPAVLALVKPSLAPFALVGANRRSWWLALAGLAVGSAVFGTLWLDYLTVLANSQNPQGLLYSLHDVPLMLIPLVAWLGSRLPDQPPIMWLAMLRRNGLAPHMLRRGRPSGCR